MKNNRFALSSLLLLFALSSCGQAQESQNQSKEEPKGPKIESITLAHAPTKANYKEGEYFSPSGMVIEARFDDGTRKAVHGYSLDPIGALDPSVDSVFVSYENFDLEVPISVSPASSEGSAIPTHVTIESDAEETYRVEAEDAYYKTPLTSSQYKDHSSRNKETSNLGSVGEFAVNNPMQIGIEAKEECGLTLALALAYNTETAIDPNYTLSLNGTNLVTNIIVEKGSDPYPYYTWKEYEVRGLSLQKGFNTLTFGVKSSSSAKINIDYVDLQIHPLEGESQGEGDAKWVWGELNEDYEEEQIGEASTYLAPNTIDHPDYDIHSDLQYRYLSSGYNRVSSFASGQTEASKSRGLKLNLHDFEESDGPIYVEVDESPDFSSSLTYEISETPFYLPNPLIDENYYYRVSGEKESLPSAKTEIAYSLSLAPRNLDIEGITNVRDIGGYASKLGGVVRQGLYYRGGRLNVSEKNQLTLDITEEGLEELTNRIGIKTEIDLRMNDSGLFPGHSNEFGFIDNDTFEDIEYVNHPLDWTQSDMMKQSKPMIGETFHTLAKAENYPVYLHCNIGTDRTGMITYLLGTLLGIPQEDLYRDYLYSNFGNIGGSRGLETITGKYQVDLLAMGEDNLYKDVRAYLGECGVSEGELDDIVSSFIDFDAL